MASKTSIQKKLERVRPPRVQMTYDVEVGDAIEQKEVPFVVGVLGDFGGQPDPDAAPVKLRDRKFVGVDPDSFDEVMKGIAPRLRMRVADRLQDEGGELPVELRFERLEDFAPDAVALRVAPLAKLVEARNRLCDLRNKLAGNELLEEILSGTLADAEGRDRLGQETGIESGKE